MLQLKHAVRGSLPLTQTRWQAFQPCLSQSEGQSLQSPLFVDDDVMTHTQQEPQTLMDHFAQAFKDFGSTISLKKTNVLVLPAITINNYKLDVVHQFTYLGPKSIRGLGMQQQYYPSHQTTVGKHQANS